MPAVTVNRSRTVVFGNKRVKLVSVTIASNGDTYDSKFKIIDSLSVDAGSNASCGSTQVAGVVTFASGGALSNVNLIVVGT